MFNDMLVVYNDNLTYKSKDNVLYNRRKKKQLRKKERTDMH